MGVVNAGAELRTGSVGILGVVRQMSVFNSVDADTSVYNYHSHNSLALVLDFELLTKSGGKCLSPHSHLIYLHSRIDCLSFHR